MCPALNAEAGGGGYSSQMYPVPAERRVRRVIEPERPHRRRHAWHGADDPRIVPSLRRCTQAVCLPPIAEQGRSEEHTSELQSLMRKSYAVFCLKEKRKKHKVTINKSPRRQHTKKYIIINNK